MRPVLMCRVRAFLEKVERRREGGIDKSPAKLDLKKVHKFMGHGTGNPICSGDILECYIPSVVDRPTAHYPIHWPREIAMDLFSMHCKRFEGDWHRQKSCY